MKGAWRRLLPDAERVREHRWLRWLGPAMQHPRLWRITRRGVALGVALGVFFGLLIPIAQIPLSAAVAVILRANVPTAVASTLVTNPVTFAPLYYTAYRIGTALIGEGKPRVTEASLEPRGEGIGPLLAFWWGRITALGRPLLLGLAILACTMGLSAYLLITLLWRLKISWAWRQRKRQRASR